MEVGYSLNSPTCILPWIRPNQRKKGFCVPQLWKHNDYSRNHTPKFETRRSGVFSFRGITRWRVRSKDIREWFKKIKHTATILAKMAQQRIHRLTGGAKVRQHLHHDRCHRGLERHLRHLMKVLELKAPKQKVCHPDMCIYLLRFSALNYSILIHLPRIARPIRISLQICWLMKVH